MALEHFIVLIFTLRFTFIRSVEGQRRTTRAEPVKRYEAQRATGIGEFQRWGWRWVTFERLWTRGSHSVKTGLIKSSWKCTSSLFPLFSSCFDSYAGSVRTAPCLNVEINQIIIECVWTPAVSEGAPSFVISYTDFLWSPLSFVV